MREDENFLWTGTNAIVSSRVGLVTWDVIHDEEGGGFTLVLEFGIRLSLRLYLFGVELSLRLLFLR